VAFPLTLTVETLRDQTGPALTYIDAKWDSLRRNARDGHADTFDSWSEMAATSTDGHLDDTDPAKPYILYLPNDFVTPGGRFTVQFYWDSYFIVLSLLRSGRIDLARGMVENCLFLVDRHGFVIANRKRWAAGSQLPFLSQMVREVYFVTGDLEWLRSALPVVEAEYRGYWMNGSHLVFRGLSRYHAPPCYPAEHIPAITIDHEATWDLSPRFEVGDVLSLLPVDLNSNLYLYEKDMAFFCAEMADHHAAGKWLEVAERRKETINSFLWDEVDQLDYDYDFSAGLRKPLVSLAAWFPVFAGIANEEQARGLLRNLYRFERDFGLVTCETDYGFTDRQWNYPVGWAPLHWIVYKALAGCGQLESARRLALKWLSLNLNVFRQTGSFFEKYDVVSGTHEVLTDRYRNQEGFGWTNAVFHLLVNELTSDDIRSG
jgi:alpha,alpha-trehalase